MSRYEPKNREEAFAYQLEDCVKTLHALAFVSPADFEKGLKVLESYIGAYRSRRLLNAANKAIKKSKERDAYMMKNYPTLWKR